MLFNDVVVFDLTDNTLRLRSTDGAAIIDFARVDS